MKLYGDPRPSNLNPSHLLWMMLAAFLVLVAILLFPRRAFGGEQVVYSFTGGSDGTSSNQMIADRAGNLYGTTPDGGSQGAGTVFELSPPAEKGGAWTKTTLYSFSYASDSGIGPRAGLLMDASGNLYGTTWLGGPAGGGIVFELSPPTDGGEWTFSTLYGFGGPNNNLDSPEAPLAGDQAGNLYGTTAVGGTGQCIGGCGGIFQLTPPTQPGGAWTETVLHNFPGTQFGGVSGAVGGLTMDSYGALYGAAFTPSKYYGLVYRLTPPKTKHGHNWAYHVIYTFAGGTDGSAPDAPLVFDENGNLYGTTSYGGYGSPNCDGPCGTVFQLTPQPTGSWTHTVLYSFNGGADGGYSTPGTGLTIDTSGNLYGSTSGGGGSGCSGGFGCGTVFKLAPPAGQNGSWTETILYRFAGSTDGASPGTLTLGKGKLLYGPAVNGTNDDGLIFSVNR